MRWLLGVALRDLARGESKVHLEGLTMPAVGRDAL